MSQDHHETCHKDLTKIVYDLLSTVTGNFVLVRLVQTQTDQSVHRRRPPHLLTIGVVGRRPVLSIETHASLPNI